MTWALLREVSDRREKSMLWFVRHGESTWNAAGLVQGQAEGPVLTAKGRSEAAEVVSQLGDVNITAIYTSDLERAHQTAAIIARSVGVPLQRRAELRERCFGVAQGRPLSGLDPGASGIEGDRVIDASARPRGGETLGEMYKRVGAFIEELERRQADGDVLVVTHGGVIRVAQAYCNGIDVADMAWVPVANASLWGLSRVPSAVAR
jgi:2,3-bisphosphoglycerate-dependent phosphoglycerate mutase